MRLSNLIFLLLIVSWLFIPRKAQAYIAVPASRLTLPEVMLEFPNVLILTVEKCDPAKGAFLFKVTETIQGKAPEGLIKQALLQEGQTPDRLKKLAPGDTVISFTGSPDNRSLNFCKGGWYLTHPNQGWERFAQFRDDFGALFYGEPQMLAKTVKNLNDGQKVQVRIRSEAIPETPSIFVTFDPDFPHRRLATLDPMEGKPQTLEATLKGLSDKNPAQRQRATIELSYRLADHPELVKELLKRATDSHPEVRLAAIQGLARLTGEKKEAIQALTQALNDEDRFVCASAAYVLGQYGQTAKPALKALIESLKDRNFDFDFRPHRACEAAEAILKISDEKEARQAAFRLLTGEKMLNDERPDSEGTRTAAARALGRCGTAAKDALPELVKRLGDPLPETRIASAEAILLIGGTAQERESAQKVLADELHKGTIPTRIKAIRAVLATKQTSLIEEVEKLTQESPLPVQNEAKQALKKLKSPSN